MWKNLPLYGLLTCLSAVAGLSCSSPANSPNEGVPNQVESGFVFLEDAFVFTNFGGDVQPQLSPDLVARMCGAEVACQNGELPCELNPVAQAWMESTNVTLDQGRSEGFAVLSLMFFTGQLDPVDFGGPTVSDLRLTGNPKLQKELAYWSATQAVPSVTRSDVRYTAADVLPFLAETLQPDSPKRYRLAIAQRTELGFTGGHALTPIGYYKGEGDVYWLRVYDNNFPQQEQRLEINPVANTWRYEFPGLEGEMIVYEGNPENGNLLYFSPVDERLGTLTCPFDPNSETVAISYSGLTVVETDGDGAQTGIVDGKVVESGNGKVVPGFSACPRCGGFVQVINQQSMAAGVRTTRSR